MGLGNQKEEMINTNWEPKHNLFFDQTERLVSPVIPKSACTTLRHYVFNVDDNPENMLFKEEFSQSEINDIPNDYDCLMFIREPLDRMISGIAEVMYRQLIREDLLTSEGITNYQNSDRIEEFIWNFVNHNDTKTLKGMFKSFTAYGALNIHVEQQTTIMDWQNLQNKFKNITMIEVDENLWPNITQWMNERGTPISNEPYVNANLAFRKGHKAYIKGIYTLAVKDNRNNLLDDYKEYFQTDIDFYNSHKAEFYRGAEQ